MGTRRSHPSPRIRSSRVRIRSRIRRTDRSARPSFALISADEHLREKAFAGQFDYTEGTRQAFAELFEWWLRPRGRVLPIIDYFEGRGHSVEGANEFRAACEDVVGIITPDAEFFGGDELAELRDRAIDEHRAERDETAP